MDIAGDDDPSGVEPPAPVEPPLAPAAAAEGDPAEVHIAGGAGSDDEAQWPDIWEGATLRAVKGERSGG